jgi:hypothetical protein
MRFCSYLADLADPADVYSRKAAKVFPQIFPEEMPSAR